MLADPGCPFPDTLGVPLPVAGPVGQVAVVGPILIHDTRGGEEMAGQPLLPGEHLQRPVGDSQVNAAADVRERDGVEVALEHHVPVLLHSTPVDPPRDLERDLWQGSQQRLLLRLEHPQSRPCAFLERFRVERSDPLIDRRAQLRQGRELPVAERRDHPGRDVPDGVLDTGLVFRLLDPPGQHRGGVVRRKLPIRVVEHDLTLRRVGDDTGLEVVGHDPRNRAAEPVEHRDVRV